MNSTQKWVLRVLKPRTRFACFLWFVPVFVVLFILIGGLLALWEYLGLDKPRPSVTTSGLFLASLFTLWKFFFPSGEALEAYWLAEDANHLDQRIAALEKLAMRGDSNAAAALGDIYFTGSGAAPNFLRSLHYFNIASAELPSAKLQATAVRLELADAQAKRQRAELEAKIPDVLDATCPNCAGLLDMSSVKCHQCGAIFATTGAAWGPVPITGQTAAVSNAAAIPSQTNPFGRPSAKTGLREQSSNASVKTIARVALWGAHFCLVVSVLAIGLGYSDSILARLIVVAAFLYLAWAAWAVVAAVAGYFNPQKNA